MGIRSTFNRLRDKWVAWTVTTGAGDLERVGRVIAYHRDQLIIQAQSQEPRCFFYVHFRKVRECQSGEN